MSDKGCFDGDTVRVNNSPDRVNKFTVHHKVSLRDLACPVSKVRKRNGTLRGTCESGAVKYGLPITAGFTLPFYIKLIGYS
jgi:hypothetical protein